MSALNWSRAKTRDYGERRMRYRASTPGLTNKQAQYIAALQKRLGVPYTGNTGLSRISASELIENLQRRLKQ